MASPFAELPSNTKPPPRGVWGKTPLSGKLLSIVIFANLFCFGINRSQWSAEEGRIWSIIAVLTVIAVVPLSILELVGVLDDKGRKFPSALSLGIASLMLCLTALVATNTIGFGQRLPGVPATTSHGAEKDHPPLVAREAGFRLTWPGDGWFLMSGEEAHRRGFNAEGGATNPGLATSVFVMILPEQPDLEKLAHRLIDIAVMDDKRTIALDKITFVGKPAIRYRLRGKTPADGQYHVTETVLFAHQGKTYYIGATGPDTPKAADGSTVKTFLDAFSLLDAQGS
jgi:hypothetical protein